MALVHGDFPIDLSAAARGFDPDIGDFFMQARRPIESNLMSGGISDVFWIFLILSMLQPWLRQKLLDSSRVKLIHRLEKQRNSRVILLVHRQETMSFLGFPLVRYIDINDAEEVIRAIHLTDNEMPIDLVLHTPGGLVLASLQIARAIKAHGGKVRVFVPHYAMSGGTLISLAADEIVMDSHAVLGPVDPQLGQYPAASLVKVVKTKDINEVDDKTLIMADVAEKALHQIRAEIVELLADTMPADQAESLADRLSQGTWTHDHPISLTEAQELGLPAHGDMPKEFYELLNLFPQPVQRQPTVQYIPEPYGRRASPAASGW
jgi:ClpP class serine protease